MNRFFVGLAWLILTTHCIAVEPNRYQKFLEKERPQELDVLAQGGMMCLLNRSQLNEVVRGEALKHKIKPLFESVVSEGFYLHALLKCNPYSLEPYIFAYSVEVRFMAINSGYRYAYFKEYSDLGTGSDPKEALESFRESVQSALLDYVEANLANF
ncbi:hypothetical protein [Marinobacter sp. F4206]|uniref:hypothetical protein n=1 Tax=Marinobacter sp. F4206 TaxID=2861777 RepID=UPI001C5D9A98|nr:hypothetical protein [Marinobacter sp. F4206]MBW4933277.1 hypothetical protein [Marinobacter sp. F4206]